MKGEDVSYFDSMSLPFFIQTPVCHPCTGSFLNLDTSDRSLESRVGNV